MIARIETIQHRELFESERKIIEAMLHKLGAPNIDYPRHIVNEWYHSVDGKQCQFNSDFWLLFDTRDRELRCTGTLIPTLPNTLALNSF